MGKCRWIGRRHAGGARDLIVGGIGRQATQGWARLGPVAMKCALGRGGRTVRKREGDGATPIGRWKVREVLVRADGGMRWCRHVAGVPVRRISMDDGWCDAPGDRNYNRPVRHPYPASAERLWRTDHLYDAVIVLGYNDQPRRRGAGSAIFLHLSRRQDTGRPAPTEGCVALGARELAVVLAHLTPGSAVRVLG